MTTCKHCANIHWTEKLADVSGSMEWVLSCTNCGHTRKIIKRKPKGFWITEGEIAGQHVYLTSDGWKTFEELKSAKDMCYYRKTRKINILLATSFEVSNIFTSYHAL